MSRLAYLELSGRSFEGGEPGGCQKLENGYHTSAQSSIEARKDGD